MTSTERARAFLRTTAKKTALVILPLAAAAVSHASSLNIIFSDPSATSLTASGQAINLTGGVGSTQFPGGISIFSTSPIEFVVDGNGAGNGNACGAVCVGLFASGGGSGVFPGDALPVHYDFTVAASNLASMVWDVETCIDIGKRQVCNGANGSTPADTESALVNGSFDISGLNGQTLNGWDVSLQIDFASGFGFASNDTVTVNLPELATVDIGPTQATPEPGTGWMLATAGAAWFLLRKKLRRA